LISIKERFRCRVIFAATKGSVPMSWRRKPAVHWRLARLAALVVLASTAAVTPSWAQAPGYVRVKLVKAALVVGVGGGSGVLTYRGRNYPFRVSGLSVGFAAGASVSRLEGWASGIRQVSDFAGTYSSVGGGGAFVGGAGGVQLGNEKGVTIALRGGRAGMEFAGHVGQVVISLKGR
jgi:hypothetical protein